MYRETINLGCICHELWPFHYQKPPLTRWNCYLNVDGLPCGIPCQTNWKYWDLKTWATGYNSAFFRASLFFKVWENIRLLDGRVKEKNTNGCVQYCSVANEPRRVLLALVILHRPLYKQEGFLSKCLPTDQWIMPERKQNFIVPVMCLDNHHGLIVLILLRLSMITLDTLCFC